MQSHLRQIRLKLKLLRLAKILSTIKYSRKDVIHRAIFDHIRMTWQ